MGTWEGDMNRTRKTRATLRVLDELSLRPWGMYAAGEAVRFRWPGGSFYRSGVMWWDETHPPRTEDK